MGVRISSFPPSLRIASRWVFAVSAAALTFELALRPIYSIRVTSDREFGPIIEPGTTVHWRVEGAGTSRWADRGIRGANSSATATRVLVLGDSQTEALMVDDDVVYTAQLETALRHTNPNASVLNAGKSSHSVVDYVRLAPSYTAVFQPSWTIIQVRDSDFGSDAWNQTKRHFALTSSGLSIVDVPEPVRHGPRLLLWNARQRSAFIGYGAVRAGRFREAMAHDPPLFRAGDRANVAPSGDETIADWPIDAEFAMLREAWANRLTIFYLPPLDPEDPSHVTAIGEWLARACAATGTSFVTLGSAFPELVARGRTPYGFENTRFNDGHMNPEGHAAAARLLVGEVARLVPR